MEIPAAAARGADLPEVGLLSCHGIDAIHAGGLAGGLPGEEDVEVVARGIDADGRVAGVTGKDDAVVTPAAGRKLEAERVRPGPGLVDAALFGREMRRHVEPAVRLDDVAVDLALGIGPGILAADVRDLVDELGDLPARGVVLEKRSAVMRRVRRAREVHVPVGRETNSLPLTVQFALVVVEREGPHPLIAGCELPIGRPGGSRGCGRRWIARAGGHQDECDADPESHPDRRPETPVVAWGGDCLARQRDRAALDRD